MMVFDDPSPESDASYQASSDSSSLEDGVIGLDHKNVLRSSFQKSREDHEAINEHVEQISSVARAPLRYSFESDSSGKFYSNRSRRKSPAAFPNLGHPSPLHTAENHITLNILCPPPSKGEDFGGPVDSSLTAVNSEAVTIKVAVRNGCKSVAATILVKLEQDVTHSPFGLSNNLRRASLNTQAPDVEAGLTVAIYKDGFLLYGQQFPAPLISTEIPADPDLMESGSDRRAISSSDDESIGFLQSSSDETPEMMQSDAACYDSPSNGHPPTDGKESLSLPILKDSTRTSSAQPNLGEQEPSLFVEQTSNTANKGRRATLSSLSRSRSLKAFGIR